LGEAGGAGVSPPFGPGNQAAKKRERREEVVLVRVSAAERAAWEKLAAAEGVSVPELVRRKMGAKPLKV